MKNTVILIAGAIAVAFLIFVSLNDQGVEAQDSVYSYDFLLYIEDTVEYQKDTWEITAVLEQKSEIDGKIYPYYRLSRSILGYIDHIWVWAPEIDDPIIMREGDDKGGDPNDPPPCPRPPC